MQVDDAILFHQLSGLTDMVGENKFETSLLQATGDALGGRKEPSSTESKLSKVLTVLLRRGIIVVKVSFIVVECR